MPATLTVGLAQFAPIKGNISENLAQHVRLIEQAAKEQVRLLVFPELSLTGYEPELAKDLALEYTSEPLCILHDLAKKHSMTILAGTPLYVKNNKPELALAIISPDAPTRHYSKMHLYGIENSFFSPGNQQTMLTINSISIGLAVCADITHPEHVQHMVDDGADCYLASVLISEQGYSAESKLLSEYARHHNIIVGMANFVGHSGPYSCAGNSTFWGKNGNILTQASKPQPAVITTTISK
ncbi:carbon-nitrogen hydrolase family protein [Halodesulfovibrio aestuarii]|uniref:carbon-nitrogen hydrolase family protein n=1 Tax=Halodesulfovibrio aestuarii TaxID=126333 RepID=UPI003522C716